MDRARSASEVRFVERLLGWLDTNLPALPPDCPERRLLEYVAAELAARHHLSPLGSPRLATLDDASAELLARLAEVGADPMTALTPDQWTVVGAGIALTLDEIAEESDRTVATWLPSGNGNPLAAVMHGCGVVKGALVQSWRR